MDIIEHFKDTGALLDGHFVLSSGLHSPRYLQCALALRVPEHAERFAAMLVEKLSPLLESEKVGTVAAPAIGGLVIGFATAQILDLPFIWTERQSGIMTVRRGFSLTPGERVLVVEDVITTGGSTRECIAALEENGAKVVAAASIIDRSNGIADVGVPRVSLLEMDAKSYPPHECPLCAEGIEAIKPGSRAIQR